MKTSYVLSFIISVAGYCLVGIVIHDGWGWFITPEFGIKAPSYAVCVGFWALVRIFCLDGASRADVHAINSESDAEKCEYVLALSLTNSILFPLFYWGLMWVLYCIAY